MGKVKNHFNAVAFAKHAERVGGDGRLDHKQPDPRDITAKKARVEGKKLHEKAVGHELRPREP